MTPPDRDRRGSKKGGGTSLPPDDQEAWDEIARQIKPLKKKDIAAGAASAAPVRLRKSGGIMSRGGGQPADKAPPSSGHPARMAAGRRHPGADALDRRTDDRLRKGKMRPEGRLDLHGMTQDAARAALTGFLRTAHANGKRCVLVITGKGRRPAAEDGDWLSPQPGILRERVPQWLAEAPLSSLVLRTHTAQPRDGGSGALYVLLRRIRD